MHQTFIYRNPCTSPIFPFISLITPSEQNKWPKTHHTSLSYTLMYCETPSLVLPPEHLSNAFTSYSTLPVFLYTYHQHILHCFQASPAIYILSPDLLMHHTSFLLYITAGTPPISWLPWFQSLARVTILPDQPRSCNDNSSTNLWPTNYVPSVSLKYHGVLEA